MMRKCPEAPEWWYACNFVFRIDLLYIHRRLAHKRHMVVSGLLHRSVNAIWPSVLSTLALNRAWWYRK